TQDIPQSWCPMTTTSLASRLYMATRMLLIMLSNDFLIMAPAFLTIFTSPFWMFNAFGSNSTSLDSIHVKTTILFLGIDRDLYCSYCLPATNSLLYVSISSKYIVKTTPIM